MDPASAAVAFVGFSGSIATLLAVALDSCRKIHNIAQLLRDAPDHIRRLFGKVERLRSVLTEIEEIGNKTGDEYLGANVSRDWTSIVRIMEKDLAALEGKISKLQKSLGGKSLSRLHMSVRIRMFFSAEEVDKYEEALSDDLDTFNLLLCMLNNARSKVILRELKSQASDISELMTFIASLFSSGQNLLGGDQRVLRSQPADFHHAISQQIQSLSMEECNLQQKSALMLLQSLPLSQGCLSMKSQPTVCSELSTDTELLRTSDRKRTSVECGPETSTTSPCPNAKHTPKDLSQSHIKRKSRRRSQGSAKLVTERWSVAFYNFTIGTMTVRRISQQVKQKTWREHDHQTSSAVTFSLYPAPWIANRIIELSFVLKTSRYESPSISPNLESRSYNQNPRLLNCLHNGDISGLKTLFTRGEAKPKDILAPWGNSLLHEAIYHSLYARTNSMELCEFLVEQGVDINVRDLNGSTPLHLCCELISSTNNLEHHLQPITKLLIEAGSDLALCNSNGYSATSLIFQSQNGLEFLQKNVLLHIDACTLQEIEGVDLWVLAALARAFPSFHQCLQAQYAEFRTATEFSTTPFKEFSKAIELDIALQVAEVKNAKSEVRQSFLRLLCAKGTLEMVNPFLDCGINLDECSLSDNNTYIRVAARNGRIDIVAALAEAGASLDTHRPWISPSEILPPSNAVDDLLERWNSIRLGRPEYIGDPNAEYWILRDLLKNPTLNASDSIFFAIGREENPLTYQCLLEAGYGRRDGTPSDTRAQKALGSEVIWAIKSNNRVTTLLVEHGLGIECEDRFGYSALLHALNRGKGCIDFAGMLIEAGADLTRRTASGFTPLEFARKNLNAQHPRQPRRDGTKPDLGLQTVTLEEDREAYDRLEKSIRERQPSTLARWYRVSLQGAISWISELHRGLITDWSRFQHMAPKIEGLLACLGFVMTFSAFLFLTAWDFAWWAIRYRTWTLSYSFSMLLVASAILWIAF